MNHNLIYCPDDFLNNMDRIFVKKGHLIVKNNSYPDYVYIVLEGIANTRYLSCHCKDVVASFFLRGDFIGEINAICKQRYMFDAVAQSDMELVKVPADIFIERMKTDFRLVQSMVQSQNNRINYLEAFALANSALPLYKKVLLFLCCFHAREDYCKTFSKDFLAAYFGADIRSVNRVLKSMSENGFIRTGNGKIFIIDYEKLVNECISKGVDCQFDFFCKNIVDGYPEDLIRRTHSNN